MCITFSDMDTEDLDLRRHPAGIWTNYSFGTGRGKPKRSLGGRKVTCPTARPGSPLPSNMSDVELDVVLAERIMKADIPWDPIVWGLMPEGSSRDFDNKITRLGCFVLVLSRLDAFDSGLLSMSRSLLWG